jgi:hypothetical protein
MQFHSKRLFEFGGVDTESERQSGDVTNEVVNGGGRYGMGMD